MHRRMRVYPPARNGIYAAWPMFLAARERILDFTKDKATPWSPQLPPSRRGSAFYAQMDLGVAQAYELASGVIAASFAHQEGREGMDAFIEKRDPPGRSRQQP